MFCNRPQTVSEWLFNAPSSVVAGDLVVRPPLELGASGGGGASAMTLLPPANWFGQVKELQPQVPGGLLLLGAAAHSSACKPSELTVCAKVGSFAFCLAGELGHSSCPYVICASF
jgi:hypothetical protein